MARPRGARWIVMVPGSIARGAGCSVAAPESCIAGWMERLAKLEGLAICPETAICMGVLDQLLAGGAIRPSESVLVFNTGGAMKYPDLIEEPVRHIDLGQAPDWQAIAEG